MCSYTKDYKPINKHNRYIRLNSNEIEHFVAPFSGSATHCEGMTAIVTVAVVVTVVVTRTGDV